MQKRGTTLEGIILSTSSIIVISNGRTITFKTNFKKGEDVWLYYDTNNKLICVEKKTDTKDIEHEK